MDRRIIQWIESKYEGLRSELSERTRRRWAAVEAISLGRGGITAVSAATGLAHSTIRRGIEELNNADTPPTSGDRRPGAGRKKVTAVHPGPPPASEPPVEPATPRRPPPAPPPPLQETT